ncbi:MAG: hypothetical protein FD122_1235 [Stygiobacter sp.]|nr:MAG: hypothetical protein FD122_1235 [Stygiobacter sp.]KAF0218186.1 MAG: hypothetical protein FD178_66 [Ignavibacteria bacterium]
MRKFTLASLLLTTILLTNFSFAQTDSTCTKDKIQFHLVNDYSVSYLKMLSPTSGLRFKIDLGLNGTSSKQENDFRSVYNSSQETISHSNDEPERNSQYANVVFGYTLVSKPIDKVSIYFVAGPLISYSRNSTKSNADRTYFETTEFENYKNEDVNETIGIGLQLALGVDLEITNKLSLLAEFDLNGTYGWNSGSYMSEYYYDSRRNFHETTYSGTSWNYGLNRLKLGIAYRF